MNNDVGKILLIKNVVFTSEGYNQADMKSLRGRPCLVISQTDENYYMLPMSSHMSRFQEDLNFGFKQDNIFGYDKHNCNADSFVRVSDLFKRDIRFYKELGFVSKFQFLKMLKYIIQNYDFLKNNSLNGNLYDEVIKNLRKQRNDIICEEKKLVKKRG